jgi:drug/metabolite transporter (DMT)-like permease
MFGTALAFSVQVWSQRYLTAAHTGILLTLEPVFAALTSFVWLGERLSGRALLGCVLILTGILVAELKGPAQAAVDAPGPVITPDA